MTRWSIVFVLSLPLIAASSSRLVADEDSLFEQLGKMIGGAIRGETEPAPAIPMMQAAEVAVKPGEQDQQEFEKRIHRHGDVLEAWISSVCQLPDEQKVRLKEILAAQLDSEIKSFAKGQSPEQRQRPFPVTFVLLFTHSKGIAQKFSDGVFRTIRKDLLSPDQVAKLAAALEERETFQRTAYVNFLVSMIDKELFLSSAQRDALREHLAGKKTVESPLYSFQPQNYYLPYMSLSQILSGVPGKGILDASQKKRLSDLTGTDPNNQHVVFQAADGVDGWYKQMHQLGLKQRDLYLRAAAVRIAWYQRELQLSEEQVDYLTIASKGAAVRALADWKENTEQMFEQMQQHMLQAGGNFGFGASLIDTRSIDSNEIWSEAVKATTVGTTGWSLEERKGGLRSAVGASLLALMDEELWLTPDQRTLLLPQFEKSIGDMDQAIQYQDYIREVVLIAHPLFLTEEKKRNEVLSTSQQEVWKALQSFFDYQKQNNYVQIQLRNNNGNFGFQIGL